MLPVDKFCNTCLYATFGKIVIPPLSNVGADNKDADKYFPANVPA
jgi:hypothetical protein